VTIDAKNLSAMLRGDSNRVNLAGEEAGISFAPGSFNEKTNTIRMQIHGGEAVIRRPFFSEPFYLQLSTEPGAVDVSRLDGGNLHLLVDHDASSHSTIGIGVAGSLMSDPAPSVEFKLDDAPESDPNFNIIRKLKAGMLRGVSVGADWDDTAVEVSKDFRDGLSLVTVNRWELKELSVTPLPASPSAAALSDQSGATPRIEEVGMKTPDELAAEAKVLEAKNKEALTAARNEGLEQGKLDADTRRTEILESAKPFGMADDFVTGLVDGNLSAAECKDAILVKLAADHNAGPDVDGKGAPMNVSTPGAKVIAELAATAIALKANVDIKDASPEAVAMSRLSLTGIGRKVLTAGGINCADLSDEQIVSRQFSIERQAKLAGMSQSDLPNVYADVVSKIAGPAYERFEETYTGWASQTDVPHPYSTKILRLSGLPELPVIPEGGDAPLAAYSDEYEDHSVDHRGNVVRITEEMVMGDQIGQINQIISKQGSAAKSTENTVTYTALTSNPTLSDSIAMFHASHNNFVAGGAGAAPSQTTLGAAITAMMSQTFTLPDGSSQRLNLRPKYLVIPIALMTVVDALMSQLYVPTASTGVMTNKMRGLEVIVDPLLDATSTTAWYLLADKSQSNPIVYGYANARKGIQTKTDEDFLSGALSYKVGIWFGATACDWRGAYLNAGV